MVVPCLLSFSILFFIFLSPFDSNFPFMYLKRWRWDWMFDTSDIITTATTYLYRYLLRGAGQDLSIL
ncbi:uncharacterized protein BO87DRAFT_152947 [Aspergillus neoniger CBS 115656]|uniref:Uncharacterized protein n=1 Tax=Aspergillus neoniger (strain CBS 115656) TaxID=1448310 RepID=A0A318YQT7_ASPNB|nr:hypothetical protein BO87DRAFT_152947 [Aspergillus neoniger CBS 115656]PYH30498.1 hypothetical protein BO87DRAFT_152947 [Aspergillus neoniger CBS 115656]